MALLKKGVLRDQRGIKGLFHAMTMEDLLQLEITSPAQTICTLLEFSLSNQLGLCFARSSLNF